MARKPRVRNRWLTPASDRVLRWMWSAGHDGELVQEGSQVWYGYARSSPAVVNHLLRLCLIREVSDGGSAKLRRWVLNEDGRRVLDDPGYEPPIVATMRKRESGWDERKRRVLGRIEENLADCPNCGCSWKTCAVSIIAADKLACCPECEHAPRKKPAKKAGAG